MTDDVVQIKAATRKERIQRALDAQRQQPGMPNTEKWKAAYHSQQPKRTAKPWLEGKPPTPGRITMALDCAGPDMQCLDGPEVDCALGVEEPTVDLWESGELVPTTEQVRRLSVLTGWPMGFFYLPAPALLADVFVCDMDRVDADYLVVTGGSTSRRPWSATPRPKPQPRVPDNPDLHPMAAVKSFRKWQEEGGGKPVPPPPGWRPPRHERPKP